MDTPSPNHVPVCSEGNSTDNQRAYTLSLPILAVESSNLTKVNGSESYPQSMNRSEARTPSSMRDASKGPTFKVTPEYPQIDFNLRFDQQHGTNTQLVITALSNARKRVIKQNPDVTKIDPSGDEKLIHHWRQHFLMKASADSTESHTDALSFLIKALEHLDEIKVPEHDLVTSTLMSHSKALVYYEIGVHHRELAYQTNKDSDEDCSADIFSEAKRYFSKASAAYTPILSELIKNVESSHPNTNKRKLTSPYSINKNFSVALAPIMQYFDSNTPFHCLANAMYNYVCLDTDNPDLTDADLIRELKKAKQLCNSGDHYLKMERLIQPPAQTQNAKNIKAAINKLLQTFQSSSETASQRTHKRLAKASSKPNKQTPKLESRSQQLTFATSTNNDAITAYSGLKQSFSSIKQFDFQSNTFLKPHQVTQFSQILQSLEHNPRVICQMPTGTGKTAVMAALVASINHICENQKTSYFGNVRPTIIITVPSLQLVYQTREKLLEYGEQFADHFKPLATLKEKVGVWCGTEKTIRPITVTTYSSLTRLIKKYEKIPFDATNKWSQASHYFHPDNEDVALVFDEAHRCNGKEISSLLKNALNKKVVIGFSGSAGEYEDTLPLQILPPLYLTESIDNKAIAPIEFLDLQFTHHPKVKEMKSKLGLKGKNQELSKEQKEQIDNFLVTASGITLTVARTLQQLFIAKDPTVKIMVFCNTKIHVNNTKQIFNSCGIKTTITHGDLPKAEQAAALKEFETNNDTHVIVSCGQLDEGYDFPRSELAKGVSVIVDFTPHINKGRLIQQRLGRATRSAPDSYEKNATYIRIKLLTGDAQKEPWQLINENGRQRFYGQSQKALSSSESFELEPLVWEKASDIPDTLTDVVSQNRSLTAFGARLRFAHEKNNTIKLGEGVPDIEVDNDTELEAAHTHDAPINQQVGATHDTPTANESPIHENLFDRLSPISWFGLEQTGDEDMENFLRDFQFD